ncbi:UDP-N-acetylmuramate--L-alanine ligase [Papillibacter cinnamivorans]|uniref:UDP-N-acetylmuramate--L-alanine ligase n=1 Tax=Papillibacter cinnamivorans DSM 12816 TaxID=1122930 RepID=A0A1W2BW46_9FIRM|nr:UDP-N-acetylmuramate--L-alanine ligase [Papillibacter cinnamivorans]SMC77235.1 UDP-N-acetylmuramate--L-alanine ligase [Papillibacter cinnamivorans DSM 12816]
MTALDIGKYILPGKRAHLVGIGGVSMCPLAEVLRGKGVLVTGSDMKEGELTKHLRALGIDVRIGHSPENIGNADFLVRTAAVHDDNPEIAEARSRGIPVFERAQAWGAIMREYPNALCISGTHGKTTTTSMATHIAMAAGIDPTVMIGGTLPLLGAGHRVGRGGTIILESCEYCDSFLQFFPTIAVILDVDADHLDYFKDLEAVKASFRRFAGLVPEDGVVVVNADDPNAMEAVAPVNRRRITFGLREEADVRAENICYHDGLPAFDVLYKGEFFAHIELLVPGVHNILNALAATASAIALGLPAKAVTQGLSTFSGAGRRFEFKGTCRGADIYDDYAHHPSELHALLTMARTLEYRRIICAFQPHTYTRTKALYDDFIRELGLADLVFLAEIYAAREKNTIGISSRDLARDIPGARHFATLEELTGALREIASPGDLILTVGAGDIYKVGEALVR